MHGICGAEFYTQDILTVAQPEYQLTEADNDSQ